MLLSRLLANFTRGESDTLRKAMGKKLIDKMMALKEKFLKGGQANNHDPEVLEKIWSDWEKFASYAFNKSHATCYSWVAFQTAYLKANYPAEYMAAVLSRNLNDITKLTNFMDECKAMHISVKGPDVNESFSAFGVNKDGDIRFGLAGVKGIGQNVVNAIISARNEGGPFQNIYDFVERVDRSNINRRNIEGLALAGAFDSLPDIKREDFFEANIKGETFAEQLSRYAQSYQNAKGSMENSLFGDFDSDLNTAGRPPLKPATLWPDIEKLERERDLVGMYLSGHPLDPYYVELRYGCTHTIKDFVDEGPLDENRPVVLGGMVIDYQVKQSRRGGSFGVLKIEDYTGTQEFTLFGQDFIDYGKYGINGTPVLIRGHYGRRFANSDVRFQITSISLLAKQRGKLIDGLTISVDADQANQNFHSILRDFISRPLPADFVTEDGDGRCPLYIRLRDTQLGRSLKLASGVKLAVDRNLIVTLEEMEMDFEVSRS